MNTINNNEHITLSAVAEVPAKGRDTMGVKFVAVAGDDAVSVIALNPESSAEEEVSGSVDPESTEQGSVEAQQPAATADQVEPNAEEGTGD